MKAICEASVARMQRSGIRDDDAPSAAVLDQCRAAKRSGPFPLEEGRRG
jgi:hypothetical protein